MSTMQIVETSIPGCLELVPPVFRDERGLFVKTFHAPLFSEHGLVTDYAEEFYSVSRRGVLRGLHFQLPPHDVTKLVWCLAGRVLDVVVDLRVGSPACGRHVAVELSSERANMLYIPTGLAHGFLSLEDNTVMMYKCTQVYSAEHDTGIRWDSAGIAWPEASPLVSARDGRFPSLADFSSPFLYGEGTP